jgi:uncharacterized protein (TIGR03435 family)
MRRSIVSAVLCAAGSSVLFGQDFEVASVRRSGPGARVELGSRSGGPGSADPGTIRYSAYVLRLILGEAYGITGAHISGPDWLNSEKYDISAKLPPNTTPEQFSLMLQHMLAERFKLIAHKGTKQEVSYELTVAPGGPKLKEAADAPAAKAAPTNPERPRTQNLDKNGFPAPPAGSGATHSSKDGITRSTFHEMPILAFARMLAQGLNTESIVPAPGTITIVPRVEDKTGLSGKYDFTLEYEGPPLGRLAGQTEDPRGVSYISSVLEKQIGLRLEQKKSTVDVIVIDRIEKEPTEN